MLRFQDVLCPFFIPLGSPGAPMNTSLLPYSLENRTRRLGRGSPRISLKQCSATLPPNRKAVPGAIPDTWGCVGSADLRLAVGGGAGIPCPTHSPARAADPAWAARSHPRLWGLADGSEPAGALGMLSRRAPASPVGSV